ncbi:MAG: Rieske 2Fe-2S domain-containing protein [Polyangia bacterium]
MHELIHKDGEVRREPGLLEPGVTELPPPRGWFSIGSVEDTPVGTVQNHRIAGHDLVAFRGADGVLAVADAFCPHLGAHLGHGGRVDGNDLRCPFHGFCFDKSGACTRTGYNTRPPPKARLRTWPTIERHGVSLVYYDPEGAPPSFEIPDVSMEGWSPLLFHHWRLRGHPQETSENSVDIGHFPHIHNYSEVRALEPVVVEGAHLRARYSFRKPLPGVLGRRLALHNVIEVDVYGLGYSRVEVHEQQSGLRIRSLVLCTPRGDGQIDLRAALSVYDPRLDKDSPAWLRAAAPLVLSKAARRAMLMEYCHDLEQDFVIWKNKRHLAIPALALGDGPVGLFRRWARQFY